MDEPGTGCGVGPGVNSGTYSAGRLRLRGKSSARENKGHRRESRPLSPGRSEAQEGSGQQWPVLARGFGILEATVALAGHGGDRSQVTGG